jgi:cobalt-zinc-cadmium efflux system protein
MSHEHHHHNHGAESTEGISTAFFLNAFFVVVELIGGLWTNSIAILSDALHDFGDCLSLAVAWALQKKATHGRDAHYSYGYKRFSLLGSIFLSGILTVSSIAVIWEASKRVIHPEEVHAQGMLWLSIVGIVINGAAALRVKRGSSLNERAVFLHIMEDVLGWAAVLVVSVVMLFVDFPVLDPLLSIGISIWVLSNVAGNLRGVFRVMLQRVPDGFSMEETEARIKALPGIEAVHDFHVWSLDGEKHVASLHAVVDGKRDAVTVKEEIRELCRSLAIEHVTIELENRGEACHYSCD